VKHLGSATLWLALLALGACTMPPGSAATTASSRGYEEPDTGSLFGGGDHSSTTENPSLDPGLNAVMSGGKHN